jgi:hypothetical protein
LIPAETTAEFSSRVSVELELRLCVARDFATAGRIQRQSRKHASRGAMPRHQTNRTCPSLSITPLAPKAEYPIEDRLTGSMTVGSGFVFIEDTDGEKIAALDASGTLHHEVSPGGSIRWLAHQEGNLIIQLTDTSGGDLKFVDASGKVSRTLPAVYARSGRGRVIVASRRGNRPHEAR